MKSTVKMNSILHNI